MNFREKAASFILCNDDITEALELLDNAENLIPDEVIVSERFEHDSLEEVIEYIDGIESILREAYTEGIKIGGANK